MRRFNEFYCLELSSKFNTYLPIQLDASCNGLQHLALLSDEVDLFENLNLSESTTQDDPKDFYSFILTKLKLHFQTLSLTASGELKDCIIRLLRLDISRSHIKPLIMTKPYNASDFSLTNYLANNLVCQVYGELVIVDGETVLKLIDNKGNPTQREDYHPEGGNPLDNNEIPSEYKSF